MQSITFSHLWSGLVQSSGLYAGFQALKQVESGGGTLIGNAGGFVLLSECCKGKHYQTQANPDISC